MKNNIAIVGGGSAGYFTALYIKKKYPKSKVTLIESKRIPVIGVGEATTPRMLRFLHKDLGISVQEFFQKVHPTIKLGIRFEWGKEGDYYYNNPFGNLSINNSLYYTNTINNSSIISMLMDENKGPIISQNSKFSPIKLTRGFAYHIDNKLLVSFLKEKREDFGIDHVYAEINNLTFNEDGSIDSLICDKGNKLEFDFYFDCSGFKSLLLGQFLKTKFKSYKNALFTDKAITGVVDNQGTPNTYTSAITMKNGWLWSIPLRNEDHIGYVYDSSFCTDEEAELELRERFPSLKSIHTVDFQSGRREQCWVKNVIGIGNSFGFIEPLESTGIHMILTHLKRFSTLIDAEGFTNDASNRFNEKICEGWDYLRDFIAVHFKFNNRLDTPFWNKCNQEIDLSNVKEYLDYFKNNGPLSNDKMHPLFKKMQKEGIFGVFAFDINVAGCGYKQDRLIDKKKVDPDWPKHFKLNQTMVKQAITHNEVLDYFENESSDFMGSWFNNKDDH